MIFGTGAIGLATLDALRRRGETVRLVNRSGTAPVPDDVEIVKGDASDPGFTTAGKVFDRTIRLDETPDGYRAMDERSALKVLIQP